MATNRRRRVRNRRDDAELQVVRRHLVDGDVRPSDWHFTYPWFPIDHYVKPMWERLRDDILAAHIRDHPGTRPHGWWRFDAPEPRRQVGGTGQPSDALLPALKDTYSFGVPTSWWSDDNAAIHGCGIPVDPDDPPLIESEAAYLDRHNLLTDAERKRLPAAAFEPERLNLKDDE
ncbi:hypothetical protein DRB17_13355 [Ferruginivarius sediminum]|uniref:Uncharacterized protein n=1 Tax=Ferruginivarius sediminum TaxID=2661937 RepID=A0A369TEV6_9PROT|nr:hypothetical protein DRB17_13355 [Ferruginivarius sediminum]